MTPRPARAIVVIETFIVPDGRKASCGCVSWRRRGLFGLHEYWVGWSVWTAAAAEGVAIAAGALVLVRDLPATSRRRFPHPPSVPGAHLH